MVSHLIFLIFVQLLEKPPYVDMGSSWLVGNCWRSFGTLSTPSIIPGFDPHMNLLQALSNTRTDAIGSLYREGTASWLNSMVNSQFPFTTPQVRDHFLAGLSSTKAATKQAQTFKLANEGRLKPRV